MTNTYRNPRFMPDHVYREQGSVLSSASEDPDLPLTRLVDDQGQRAAVLTVATSEDIDADRKDGADEPIRHPIERIIIHGHNFAEGITRVRLFASPDDAVYTQRTLIDGADADLTKIVGPADFELARLPAIGADRFERVILGPGSDGNHEIGELFASRILTTGSGIVNVWEDTIQDNVAVAETFAHSVYSLERGSSRRVWILRYRNLLDADMRILDEVRRLVGLRVHPFWFDPPAAGGVRDTDTWIALDDGNWAIGGNLDSSFNATGGPGNVPSLEVTSNAGTQGSFAYNFPTAISLVGKFLQFDVRQRPNNWLTSPSELTIGPTTDATNRTRYTFAEAFSAGDQAAAVSQNWTRITIDLENSASASTNTLTHDQESVASIQFVVDPDATSDGLEIANLAIVERDEQVQYVELVEFQKKQDSTNPKFKLFWDVDMRLQQVLS